MSKVIAISKENFQKEVLECELPVLVDFWTDGCGPCEAMEPVLDEFSERLDGKLKIVKFHVSIEEVMGQSNEVATKYDVMGFPTFLIFRNGDLKASKIGSMYEEEFQEFIDSAI